MSDGVRENGDDIRENGDDMLFECPHCGETIAIGRSDVRCGIFRHGFIKADRRPVNPHASKHECDRLFAEGLIYGCGKPFRLSSLGHGKYEIAVCDYI